MKTFQENAVRFLQLEHDFCSAFWDFLYKACAVNDRCILYLLYRGVGQIQNGRPTGTTELWRCFLYLNH